MHLRNYRPTLHNYSLDLHVEKLIDFFQNMFSIEYLQHFKCSNVLNSNAEVIFQIEECFSKLKILIKYRKIVQVLVFEEPEYGA